MRKRLFLDLQEKVLSIENEKKEKVFKFFDIWNRNIMYLVKEQPFDVPAVFMEFMPIEWQTLPKQTAQMGDLTFRLHIVSRFYSQTHNSSPLQEEELEYLDLPERLHDSLHLVRLTNTGTIVHESSTFDSSHDSYIESIEQYRCKIKF